MRIARKFFVACFLTSIISVFSPSAPAQAWPKIALSEFAVGFTGPVHITHAGDDSGRLFVVELGGRIYAIQPDGTRTLFLDIQGRVGSPQGSLSVAFPPGFKTSTNKHFYLNYGDANYDLVVSRFFVSADANVALPNSEQVVIKIPKPTAYGTGPAIFHSGGELAFGPDGFLYFGVGDGDTGKSPGDSEKLAQNVGSLRGKVLRLDVESATNAAYVVPATNPFVSEPGALGEIWATGVRNPWRSAFDRANGDFYLGDVGQDVFEEINFQAAGTAGGLNFGWSVMEGTELYTGSVIPPANHTPPIATYIIERNQGDCSITAGRVYRGPGNPRMQGVYFYGDFCTGKIWGLRRQNGIWATQLVRSSPPEDGPVLSREGLVSFGEDQIGNLYLTDRIAGKIFQLSDTSSSVNSAPTASNHSTTTQEDQPVNLLLPATDPDGDALTFTVVSAPTHGTLSGTAPSLIYTPAANYSGSDSFTFTASDGVLQSNVATVSLSISAVNDAPIATSMMLSCNEDASASITLSGSDVENDPLNFAVITGPTHGTLTGAAPNLTYTPVANYAGSDTFSFRASDPTLASSPATVSITVTGVNDAPVAMPQSVSGPEDGSISLTLLATDLDGDALTYQITSPAHGTLSGTGANRVYKPALNYYGADNFNYQANDGIVLSNPVAISITVTPVNDAPVAVKDAAVTKKGTPVVVDVLRNDTDVDLDTLTITSVSKPLKGTAELVPGGIRYTPSASTSGNVNFTYSISDGKGGTATGTVTVTVNKK